MLNPLRVPLKRIQADKNINSFSRITTKTVVPANALLLTFIFNACFGLLYLGPSVAFNAYVASCTIFLNVSYALPVVIVIIRGRKILEQEQIPFSLGKFGRAANYIGVLFVGVTSVFFCFPAEIPTSTSTMSKFTTREIFLSMMIC